MGMRRLGMGVALAGALLALAMPLQSPAQLAGASEPVTTGGPVTLRRLNETQYGRSIADAFGEGIKVPGRFDPALREGGLLAIGDGKVAVSTSGLEQYELRAREIAAQVLAPERRKALVPCTPKVPSAFDRACASAFLGHYGRLLFRRPLEAGELAVASGVAASATGSTRDFYKGLEAGLSRLLISPNFIFRVERSEPDPARPGARRLDGWSLAARISFLLWDAPPDAALLDAAASGALHDPAELQRQVERMIAAPRFEQGVRAFFLDMFALDRFEGLSKDQAIFPKYTSQLAKDAREQLLRTVVDQLVTRNGDYRDLFVTRQTFMNRNLGALYRVPLEGEALKGWVPHTFGAEEPRGGVLTLAGFLMLDPTHEGRSSPTIRGKSVREQFLCEEVPMPPPNVNFSIVQNTADPLHKTARDRLKLHSEDPTCAGCHKITDPIGLAMENYDAIGGWRSHENGAPIDASGLFEGKTYSDALGLSRLIRESPAAPACLVQRTFEYGAGRQLAPGEQAWLEHASSRFAADNFVFPALLRRVATSKAFQAVAAAPAVAAK